HCPLMSAADTSIMRWAAQHLCRVFAGNFVQPDFQDALSMRIPPVDAVQRWVASCAYGIERLFVEVRRRVRAKYAFTTRDSCERILYSVFHRLNQHRTQNPL